MKSALLSLIVFAGLGTACTTVQPLEAKMKIQPILSVRHGAPDAQSYYQLGRYFQGQKRLIPAEEAYLRAITADDHHGEAYNALGTLYAEAGNFDQSRQMFRKALAVAPNSAHIHNNLGYAYMLEGRYEEAYVELRQALNLDPAIDRSWINLQHIAAAYADTELGAAIQARQLDNMPAELPQVYVNGGSRPATAGPNQEIDEPSSATTPTQLSKTEISPTWTMVRTANSENFYQRSAVREVTDNGGTIRLELPPVPVSEKRKDERLPLRPFRLEVSNGNGVSGFAKKFSNWLSAAAMPVRRITNYDSYLLRQTVIEYQPGYESAARHLVTHTALSPKLIPAARPRVNSDIRVVLGRDALQTTVGPLQHVRDASGTMKPLMQTQAPSASGNT